MSSTFVRGLRLLATSAASAIYVTRLVCRISDDGNSDHHSASYLEIVLPKTSRPLLIAMVVVLIITFALPYSPLSELLSLKPLAASTMMLLGIITLLYVAASEVAKRIFLRKVAKDYPKHPLTEAKSKLKFRHGPCPT